MPSVSQKQANLMSAIKHGWDPPAGMHAPSMAVASEFHAADKKVGKFMHAEGGKVQMASDAIGYLKQVLESGHGLFGHNTSKYRKILPPDWAKDMTEQEAQALLSNAVYPLRSDNPRFNILDAMLEKYSLHLPDHLTVHRGMEFDAGDDVEKYFQRGQEIKPLEGPTSTSLNFKVAKGFSESGLRDGPRVIVRMRSEPALSHYTPNPVAGQDELMVSPTARYQVDDLANEGDDWFIDATRTKKAEGGPVDISDPSIKLGILAARSHPQSKTNRFLGLVSHAADRATSTVTDDPHHALARVASGLASQVAGQTRSGRVEFGRLPNLVDEIKSLPAGLTDIGLAGTNLLGGLSDKYLPHVPGDVGDTLSRLRDAANAYVEKHGDPAPQWSRDAEARANAMHGKVNKLMGLSDPKGFIENTADATGTMLGQLPLPLGEAKTVTRGGKAGLAALLKAVPEYMGPTIRPSLRNYATGALGGGALGALVSPAEAAQAPPPEGGPPMKERFE